MAFAPPTFNLTVNLWRAATVAAGPFPLPAPDLTFQANLSFAKNRSVDNANFSVSGKLNFMVGVELLCPKGTDVRGHLTTAWDGDLVEAPAGTGRLYTVGFVEDVGRGFGNEYRLALIWQLSQAMIGFTALPWNSYLWPTPTP